VNFTFVLLAVLAIAGGLGMITFKNAIYSALSLVGTMLSLAMMYFTMDAQFLSAVQVIVYAGAIMVLFLFVIMLLNAALTETRADPIPWVVPTALVGGLGLAGVLSFVAFSYKAPRPLEAAIKALEGGTPGPVGEVLFTKFLLPFESVSILLLIAVVGAVALVRRDIDAKEELEETLGSMSEFTTDALSGDGLSGNGRKADGLTKGVA
jgi:NADH-quinone oxidoreductase subunit J